MASSANIGALNPEWSALAGKVAGAFYSPGSAADVAARTEQNREGLGVGAAPPTVAPVAAAPAVSPAKTLSDDIQKKYFTAPAPDYDATVKAAALTNIGATPSVTVNQGTPFNPAPLTANAPRGVYNAQNTPGAVGSDTPAAAVAPAVRAPVMNEGLLAAQQNILRQINDAQAVVSAGSNRDGYKMGDVTKALMTMNMLNPTLNSVNGLVGQSYGVDASMFNHAADNVARTNIATMGNQTEVAKTNLAGQYALQKGVADNQAALGLATHKAALDDIGAKADSYRAEAALNGMKAAAAQKYGVGALLPANLVKATDERGNTRFVNATTGESGYVYSAPPQEQPKKK